MPWGLRRPGFIMGQELSVEAGLRSRGRGSRVQSPRAAGALVPRSPCLHPALVVPGQAVSPLSPRFCLPGQCSPGVWLGGGHLVSSRPGLSFSSCKMGMMPSGLTVSLLGVGESIRHIFYAVAPRPLSGPRTVHLGTEVAVPSRVVRRAAPAPRPCPQGVGGQCKPQPRAPGLRVTASRMTTSHPWRQQGLCEDVRGLRWGWTLVRASLQQGEGLVPGLVSTPLPDAVRNLSPGLVATAFLPRGRCRWSLGPRL